MKSGARGRTLEETTSTKGSGDVTEISAQVAEDIEALRVLANDTLADPKADDKEKTAAYRIIEADDAMIATILASSDSGSAAEPRPSAGSSNDSAALTIRRVTPGKKSAWKGDPKREWKFTPVMSKRGSVTQSGMNPSRKIPFKKPQRKLHDEPVEILILGLKKDGVDVIEHDLRWGIEGDLPAER